MPTMTTCRDIPTVELDLLAAAILPALQRFYADPAHRREFEAWKNSKRDKEEKQNA